MAVPAPPDPDPAPTPAMVPPSDPPEPAIDLAEATERVGGNQALLLRLIRSFAAGNADTPSRIRAALAAGDRAAARDLAHGLKGVAGNLSANPLFKVATAVERALKGEKTAEEAPLIDRLETAMAAVVDWVAVLDRGDGVAAARPLDRAQCRVLMARLDRLLLARDLEAEECMSALKAALGTAEPALTATLEAAIGVLDFDRARLALTALARTVSVSLESAADA